MAGLVNLEIFKLSSNSVKVAGYSALKSLFIQNQVRFKRKVPIVDDFNYILVFLLVDRCVQFWISPVRDLYPGTARSKPARETSCPGNKSRVSKPHTTVSSVRL